MRSWLDHDQLPESLVHAIFDYIIKNYHAFAGASIAAAGRGEKFFELDLGDGPFRRALDEAAGERLACMYRMNFCAPTAAARIIADSGIMSFYLADSTNKQISGEPKYYY